MAEYGIINWNGKKEPLCNWHWADAYKILLKK